MDTDIGKKIGAAFSFAAFYLSGCFIFNPLYKSQNIIISSAFAFITSVPVLICWLNFFDKKRDNTSAHPIIQGFFALVASIFSVLASLMLITEIIKDVSYIANRGVSLFYYISISIAILTVSYYLCYNSEKGIFRFSILAVIPFIFLFLIAFTSFITTKSAVFDISSGSSESFISSMTAGIIAGLFFSADSAVYLFCFRKYLCGNDGKLMKKTAFAGFLVSFLAVFIYNLVTFLVFSAKLTKNLTDPDYALIKLVPGIDFTETVSAIRIISFMIKSSVYIFCSSKALKETIFKKNKSLIPIILVLYLLIPITVIILSCYDKNLKYGSFQHMIYPVTILLPVFFSIITSTHKKKNE